MYVFSLYVYYFDMVNKGECLSNFFEKEFLT